MNKKELIEMAENAQRMFMGQRPVGKRPNFKKYCASNKKEINMKKIELTNEEVEFLRSFLLNASLPPLSGNLIVRAGALIKNILVKLEQEQNDDNKPGEQDRKRKR